MQAVLVGGLRPALHLSGMVRRPDLQDVGARVEIPIRTARGGGVLLRRTLFPLALLILMLIFFHVNNPPAFKCRKGNNPAVDITVQILLQSASLITKREIFFISKREKFGAGLNLNGGTESTPPLK